MINLLELTKMELGLLDATPAPSQEPELVSEPEVAVEEAPVKEVVRKVNIYNVPDFCTAMNNFETQEFKNLAIAGLEAAPLQFWIMPAAMRKNIHHSTEHGIGEVEYDEAKGIHCVNTIGGKAYHTIRVLKTAEIFLEADDPRVMDFHGKVTEMRMGNEMTRRERDLVRVACLWHDIFSGGPGDKFDSKRRGMDKDHPYYHKTEFAALKSIVTADEWELLIDAIQGHMWKWDAKTKDTMVRFHDMRNCSSVAEAYEMMKHYRIIRIVELSDLIASRDIDKK